MKCRNVRLLIQQDILLLLFLDPHCLLFCGSAVGPLKTEMLGCATHWCKSEVTCVGAQWGPLEFHKKSLLNLGEAMRRTRKLCAVMVDIVGREIILNRPSKVPPSLPVPQLVKALLSIDKCALQAALLVLGASKAPAVLGAHHGLHGLHETLE